MFVLYIKRDMDNRRDRLIVEVDSECVEALSSWKKFCGVAYGRGGIKKRFQIIIKDDLSKIKKEALDSIK